MSTRRLRHTSRRNFLRESALAAGAAVVVPSTVRGAARPITFAEGPVVISSANGLRSVERAREMILNGADALDAVIAGVNLVEEDPNDLSVGYGGLPNERGEIELDSSVMHGPTCRSGAVAALQRIKYPSRVAQLVLERTDHCLLVGKGAQDFAVMHGFEVENLMTKRTREVWVKWKETLSDDDDYLRPDSEDGDDLGMYEDVFERTHGTIHCSGIDLEGNLSGVTTTSGLSFKIPGRVGDSPIVGAGLYVDNEVGAAGSTGRGEANIENLCSYLIVERMRAGDSPDEACLYACQRIVDHTKVKHLLDDKGLPNFNVRFYALNKAGEVGGAELRDYGARMAVADAEGARLVEIPHLIDG